MTLSRLGVREDRTGEGVGWALFDAAEREAREWGRETIRFTTPAEHPFLPDPCRDRGYEETAPYPLEYRDHDEIVVEKRVR